MSKKLIAGAGVVASLAVALAPLATYAEVSYAQYSSDEHTDRFTVTVTPTCSFGFTDGAQSNPIELAGITHNASGTGVATWASGTSEAADDMKGMTPDESTGTAHASLNNATYSIHAGTKNDAFATTTLNVVCNNATGYKVAATMTNLTKGSGEGAPYIAPATDYSVSKSGYAIASIAPSSPTNVNYTAPFGSTTANSTIIEKTSKASEQTIGSTTAKYDTYTVTYGIGIQPDQESGDYVGTVLYKLIQRFDSGNGN